MDRRGDELREKVSRCKRLAGSSTDPVTISALLTLAAEYEAELVQPLAPMPHIRA